MRVDVRILFVTKYQMSSKFTKSKSKPLSTSERIEKYKDFFFFSLGALLLVFMIVTEERTL